GGVLGLAHEPSGSFNLDVRTTARKLRAQHRASKSFIPRRVANIPYCNGWDVRPAHEPFEFFNLDVRTTASAGGSDEDEDEGEGGFTDAPRGQNVPAQRPVLLSRDIMGFESKRLSRAGEVSGRAARKPLPRIRREERLSQLSCSWRRCVLRESRSHVTYD